ncbi:UAA transporter [Macleaya cordata]|uniref:UAA transporter n=1 Tax=Macleaya cordata TaxID=56857 RepID=A0A200R6B9_MACCD|nr:UAA transporter [Macleaya cordata]
MRVPYGENKEFFRYSLFLVFCNRITTSAVSAGALLASKKALDPVAPIYKYCLISVSNILTTTCQYEALKYVSFPVQTLAKCAKMIPVMVWGTLIMQKKYKGQDYMFAVLVTLGCSLFILYPAAADINPYASGRESTVWGVSLMMGYLGFDGFTSTFQDKLFKGYNMEIHNQIFYTTLCSCILSLSGLVLQGHLLLAVDFVARHNDCFFDIALLSTVATASQFFISYTIRTFGALTFATIMTTRQELYIVLIHVAFRNLLVDKVGEHNAVMHVVCTSIEPNTMAWSSDRLWLSLCEKLSENQIPETCIARTVELFNHDFNLEAVARFWSSSSIDVIFQTPEWIKQYTPLFACSMRVVVTSA